MTYEDFYRANVQDLKVHQRGFQALALCPLHQDSKRSFSVNLSTGQWFCFAGCGAGNHITLSRRLGIPIIPGLEKGYLPSYQVAGPSSKEPSSLREEQVLETGSGGNFQSIKEIYSYQYENGEEAFQVLRLEPKSFRQRHKVNGQWEWKTENLRMVPYRLPEILKASSTIFLVEGEKDVHSLEKIGIVGTTTPRGASSWKEEYGQYFKEKRVAIIPDNDGPGKTYAHRAAETIARSGGMVKIVELPGLGEKEDVSDFLEKGGTKDGLLSLVRQSAPFAQRSREIDPITYFKEIGLSLHDGACVLPFEFKDLCANAYQEFLKVAGNCTEDVFCKICEAESIWKNCHTLNQYSRFLKNLQQAHELSIASWSN